MSQYIAFTKWMCHKALKLPLVIIALCRKSFADLCKMLYSEGAAGFILAGLIGLLAFLSGMIIGLVVEIALVGLEQVQAMGVLKYAIACTVIFELAVFLKVCWIAFIEEQQRLIKTLKE